ncbi:MAG: folate-binding protein YgfZ [Rhodospirillales bacterium]|nr:folate-binding protein YgfZ [Rhodospirillales bacterium]
MSIEPNFSILEDRGILAISGEDRVSFLQGLVSNDVKKAGPGRAIYAALLTPQGKYLHDFFIVEQNGALLLDCEKARLEDLIKRLTLYKLRVDVTLQDRSDELTVAAIFGDGWAAWAKGAGLPDSPGAAAAFGEEGIVYADPRLADVGGRAIVLANGAEMAFESADFKTASAADYDRLRLQLGLPDGSRDMIVEKSILLESGFDELGGVDWDKGCYMGQELTARTKYRGLVKKRLMPVTFDGPPPAPATPIMLGEKEAGEVRSSVATEDGGVGLALMRLEAIEDVSAKLIADGVSVAPSKPGWMTVQE